MPGSQPTPTRSNVEPVACAQVRPDCRTRKEAANRSATGSELTRIRARRIRQGKIMFARRPCRHLKTKQAAPDVNHVPILDILWSYWLTMNGWPKVNGLATLFAIDYASQMNIAGAAIVTHTTGLHNR